MRYPGRTHQERQLQIVAILAAVIFFAFSISVFTKTQRNQSIAVPNQEKIITPAPSISLTSKKTLAFYNSITGDPLKNQSIAFLLTSECVIDTPCPTSTPLVLTTNENGEIPIDESVIRQKPKLYAAGYKIDRYFSLINDSNPNELTVLKPVPGRKAIYSVDKESAAIGLTPVEL